MTDEKILAVYQQVRSRHNFFDYWDTVTKADQTLNPSDSLAKADKAFDRDVIIAFAKEIALWWGADS